jgi:hypothetical protein
MSTSIEIYFSLKSDSRMNFEEIENSGIIGTSKHQIGDAGKYNNTQKYSRWEYSTDKIKTYKFQSLLKGLIAELYPHKDFFKKIIKENDFAAVLEAVIEIDFNESEPTPDVSLDKAAIDFLAETGTIFDVDLYRIDTSNDI